MIGHEAILDMETAITGIPWRRAQDHQKTYPNLQESTSNKTEVHAADLCFHARFISDSFLFSFQSIVQQR